MSISGLFATITAVMLSILSLSLAAGLLGSDLGVILAGHGVGALASGAANLMASGLGGLNTWLQQI